MSEKLKPCPFCGGEAVLDSVDYDAWYVQCIDYDGDCEMRPSTELCETSEDAVEIWNRRAGISEALECCPFCGREAVAECVNGSWHVECADFDGDCDMKPHTRAYKTREEAIKAWNRRAPNE